MVRYVTYKRVSTKEQGKSGLGLEAQERDISIFLETYSTAPWEVIGDFVEVQSGTEDDRPELAKAVALAKKEKAVLLVAKLDRLSRKVSFISSLMDDKSLNFRVATMPQADKFQLHIYAALAEQERDFISQRTKAALREAKAKGVKLGGLRDKTMKRNKVLKEQARAKAMKLDGIVSPMRERGDSLRQIAAALTEAGIATSRGGTQWQAVQVKRVVELIA
ncbi:MAG: recombinase family protein [Rhodospirillales bacterium]|jgi:DNA invertase Pin-like site-specific DNA recombinase|nr:recombinase family protein [Rhodospirillales bacterium]MBT4627490.1 recombinase family protein [Rhodospirillales bacterium]MBT5350990.1 recombinase family protein [Rhodospirillales bacterium]MBT6824971.1 recombinase family protein [Rhodospirillales bacterium]MBT7505431.1 recombinase family protein [Rhodospirillales bacterium]